MHDIASRLVILFSNCFSGSARTGDSVGDTAIRTPRDSVAAITLANVIEEEFQIEIDFDDMADLDSYSSILNYLSPRRRTCGVSKPEQQILRFHHVGIVVASIQDSIGVRYNRSLGAEWDGKIFEDPNQKVRVTFLFYGPGASNHRAGGSRRPGRAGPALSE